MMVLNNERTTLQMGQFWKQQKKIIRKMGKLLVLAKHERVDNSRKIKISY
jgi:hypothetical protein